MPNASSDKSSVVWGVGLSIGAAAAWRMAGHPLNFGGADPGVAGHARDPPCSEAQDFNRLLSFQFHQREQS